MTAVMGRMYCNPVLICGALAAILDMEDDLEVIAHAGDGEKAVKCAMDKGWL